MRHLLDSWDEVAAQLGRKRTIALFLDFDGTLTRIRARPEHVSLDAATRRTLSILARSPRFRVWVISGRRRDDVRRRVRVPGIQYLGLYGWESEPQKALPECSRYVLDYVRRLLGGAFVTHPSVWVEDKEYALSVHYRSASDGSGPQIRQVLETTLASFNGELRLNAGKQVWEILPRELEDKGAAVRRELTCLACGATPVYLGDDIGDEPAFAELTEGITVRVGRARGTRARYHLANFVEVRQFLQRMRSRFA